MTIRVFPLMCLCAMLACVLQGALPAGVARAAPPALVSNGQFADEGALGVAVAQSSGDVFVTGFLGYEEEHTVQGHSGKFTASGEPISLSAPFAEGGDYGAAVNPTDGDLYVAHASGEIDTYDPTTGELLSSFSAPPFATNFLEVLGNMMQIAADSAGNVYVPNVPNNEVLEYSPSGAPVMALGKEVDKTKVELREREEANREPVTVTKEQEDVCTGVSGDTCGPGSPGAGAGALSKPTGVAVDASGDLWVADSGNNRIEELSATGAFLDEIKSEGVKTIALDGRGDVLAIVQNGADDCGLITPPCAHLVEYGPGGVQLVDLGAGELGSDEKAITQYAWDLVAVNTTSGRVYVSDAAKSRVLIFQPPVAPVVGRESAVEVGTSEAKLGALVSPGGAGATYRFEYDTREYKEGEGSHGVSVPFPEGSAGEGFSPRTVWASTKGLTPGTTYYYRAVVTNGVGEPVVGSQETFTTATLAQAACPNEDTRGGFSAALPDCRAYELVTPTGATSAQPDTGDFEGGVRASAGTDGNWVAFPAGEVMPGSQSAGLEFIAARGPGGWSIEDALPLQSYTDDRCTTKYNGVVKAYSAELTKEVVLVNNNNGSGHESSNCHGAAVEIVPGEPLEEENLLVRDNENATYRLINLTPPGVIPTPPSLLATSADLNVVVFSERAKLTPEAENNTVNTYEWREGVVRLLQFESPSGAPVAGTLLSISNDGAEMFFTADGHLYVRLNGGERTVQLDHAQGGSGPGGGGALAAVTADESQVFFTDNATAGLTSDTVPGSGTNLYVYNVDTGQLSDLTPFSDANATVQGIGEDGSYLYFDSPVALTGPAANQFGEKAENGNGNLYLDHEGTITFVMHGGPSEVSANGEYFTFGSSSSLTGYENKGAPEVYMYSAVANRFQCATCNPSGEAPTSPGGPLGEVSHSRRSISDNGHFFFETYEALLPGDTDGQVNVYEFDWGSGLHLISTGTSSSPTLLLASTSSGDDVFLLSRQTLVPQDNPQEGNVIYDARVDGGFPEPAEPPACTNADACRSAPEPQPSLFGAPSSETFSGAGNVSQAPSTPAVKVKALTRSQKLAKALTACRKDRNKRKRQACEKGAHKAYAAAKSATAKRSTNDRRASR